MTSLPKVSVVMSVYNDAERVEHAVRGILAQTFRDLELIVVDDGSSDGSGAVLDRLAGEDARLRVIHQDNTGLTRALIRGCNEARGEFIARQDSDDWSHPQRIAEQVALLDSDARIGFVSCATEYIGPGDEHLSVMSRPTDPEVATRGLLEERQGPPAHGSVMFRKSLYHAVGGYRAEFHYSQDSDLWLRMGEHQCIGYVADVRYRHRKEPRSISGARREQQSAFAGFAHASRQARVRGQSDADVLAAARALSDRIRADGDRAENESSGSVDIAYLIGSQLAQNGDARARSYLWRVLRAKPWHGRALLRVLQSLLHRRMHGPSS